MPRALLAVEADRIQDLVFRSSRLREITGGSFALEEFWRGAALAAHDRGAAVSVSAGGSFRAVFPGEEAEARAREFGRLLQDVYALEIGGLLTAEVAARGDATTDGTLADDAFRAIQRAKAHGDPPAAAVSFPYLQPCDSCARAPAACRVPVGNGETQELCGVCATRRDLRDDYRDRFLDKLRIAAGGGSAEVRALVDRIGNLPEDADHVGTLDGRGRVAYLLADGNGFGVLFAEAARRDDGFATLGQLSTTVAAAGEGALVAATLALLEAHPGAALRRRDSRSREDGDLATPVLPLITGGDDVFALVPAPWAFFFAQKFAAAFAGRFAEDETVRGLLDGRSVTLACALVFCKATFPYRFAHHVGEQALGAAKRTAKGLEGGLSVVRGVEVRATVHGNGSGPAGEYGDFALDGPPAPRASVAGLLEARTALHPLPGKRRHQVEALYGSAERGSRGWQRRREWVVARSGDPVLREVLDRLDAKADAGGTPVVDLLHLWDYLKTPGSAEGVR
jgi:hypothetical protein